MELLLEEIKSVSSKNLLKYRGDILKKSWFNSKATPWLPEHQIANDFINSSSSSTMDINNLEHEHEHEHRNINHEIHLCNALFKETLKSLEVVWPPPEEMPSNFKTMYLLDDLVQLGSRYLYNEHNGGEEAFWSKEEIKRKGELPNTCGVYTTPVCHVSMQKYKHLIFRKTAAVFGSMTEWLEALLLNSEYQAEHVTTVGKQ